MAKHGIVTVSEEGVASFDASEGVIGYMTDALTTVLSTTKAPVGAPALVQRIGLAVGGNIIGIHSATGKLGMGALGKNIVFGG